MRELLFRGKRVDNGEWVCGYYFEKQNPLSESGQPIAHCISDAPPFGYEVQENTVGQYTGLTDKNGKKIFEGDIIRWRKERGCGCFIGQVIYGSGCFCCKYGANSPAIDIVMNEAFTGVEVIGNIYDNPELLEG